MPLRIVYPVGKGHLTALALEAGAFALRFFADYFDIPYPGDKLDMVAIPDFAFGAMENLGCVTYRETALLIDPATASLAEMQRVAEVVAHEIAHMWFGDLVTMEWWEGIWLNEAFATFMADPLRGRLPPEWKMWVGFGVDRDAALADRRPAHDATHRVRGRLARRHARHVRRAHLPEGWLGPAHARAVPRCRRPSATASATTCASTATPTPSPPTCGTRSRRPRASRCAT